MADRRRDRRWRDVLVLSAMDGQAPAGRADQGGHPARYTAAPHRPDAVSGRAARPRDGPLRGIDALPGAVTDDVHDDDRRLRRLRGRDRARPARDDAAGLSGRHLDRLPERRDLFRLPRRPSRADAAGPMEMEHGEPHPAAARPARGHQGIFGAAGPRVPREPSLLPAADPAAVHLLPERAARKPDPARRRAPQGRASDFAALEAATAAQRT